MPSHFPPSYLYPDDFDNDSTLFLVYNTTETVITTDNAPWSDEINIRPVRSDKSDIWADNGFATISGELLYYDDVGKNVFGKVVKLKKCTRNLGGKPTIYNPVNTPIRSFVIAEHHNQLVDTTIAIEQFLGTVDCQNEDTLTCCLAELDIDDCQDDNGCPSVQFDFQIASVDACAGTTINYQVAISGGINKFLLDFGDGTSTSVANNGTKVYSPGSNIDPVVTVQSNTCEIVLTGVSRSSNIEPPASQPTTPLTIAIQNFVFPALNIPSISINPINITLPPIAQQCIDLKPIDISIGPISIGDIPSIISIIPPSISNISLIVPQISPISLIAPSISPISLIDALPDFITLVGNIPTTISVNSSIPSRISIIGSIPSIISVKVPSISPISVNWGTPPSLSCTVSISCPSATPLALNSTLRATNPFTSDVIDPTATDSDNSINVDYAITGLPDKIMVEVPNIPAIKLEHDLPSVISLIAPDLPKDISLVGVQDIPKEIRFIPPELPQSISIDATSLPKSISIDWGDAPRSIKLEGMDIPQTISIQHDIPSTISVVGMVDTIRVVGIPDFMPLRFEGPSEIPLVYKGDPLEFVVKLDMQNLVTDGSSDDSQHCFRLVPCGTSGS